MGRLSHDDHVAAIAKVNPDIEVLGRIVNVNKKVLCRCKVCNHEWSPRPESLKRGTGCPKCKRVKIAQKLALSHKEQVAAIAKVNPNVEVLGEIVNGYTNVLCRCKVCSYEWNTKPNILKSGSGCPKCGLAKMVQKKTLSHDDHVAAIEKVNPNVEVLENIVNVNTKVLCRCKVCSHEWMVKPANLKSGSGCPKCSLLRMRLSHKEHVAAIAKVNPNVEVLESIVGAAIKVLCRCKVCNYEWKTKPANLKSGRGCPKCSRHIKLSHNEHVAAITKARTNIEILGEIVHSDKKVLCRCKVCSYEWMGRPADLKRGKNCPKCGGTLKLSHKEQVAAIAKVNPNVEVLENIVGNHTKVLCRCKVCNHEWSPTPNGLKHGRGCPKCAKKGFLSHKYGKLYIMVDDLELPTQMKIGVSVQENERRNQILKSAHKAGVRIPDLHIVRTLEGPTENIYELESTMHKVFSNYKINFPVKFDGSNEFFYYRPEVFDKVEKAFKEIVCCQ
ncbi:TPA: GIY-YIG nuclease family protein [Escherichia coli]